MKVTATRLTGVNEFIFFAALSVSLTAAFCGCKPCSVSVNPVSSQTTCSGQSTAPVTFSGESASATYTWTNSNPSIGLAGSGTGNIGAFAAVNNSSSPVTATITVTPQSSLFAYGSSGNFANMVGIFNLATYQEVAQIPGLTGGLCAAVTPDGSRVYVSGSGGVSVISTSTNAVIATITLGSWPWGIAISQDGGTVYVANFNGQSVSAISTVSNMVIKTIHTQIQNPMGVAVSPDNKSLYVVGPTPYGLNIISLTDPLVQTNIAVLGSPWAIALSPDGSKIYVASGPLVSDTNCGVSVVSTVSPYPIIKYIRFWRSDLAGIVASPDGKEVYVSDRSGNEISVIDATTNTAIKSISTGVKAPYGIAFSPDGSQFYVYNTGGSEILVFNTASGTIVQRMPTGRGGPVYGNAWVGGRNCSGSSTTFTYTVIPSVVTATVASTALNYCGTLTSGSLGGNNAAPGTGTWTQASGPGTTTFSNANSGSSTTTVSAYGAYVYTWTISDPPCGSSSANVNATFGAGPQVGISGNTNGCVSVSLTASGGPPYSWSGGNNPTSATNTFTSSGFYGVTVTGPNNCTASAAANVTVNAKPKPPYWSSISTGPDASHTLAINASGALFAWGYNDYGQLGNGNTTNSFTPIAIAGGTQWLKTATGGEHSIGINAAGSLLAWGRNDGGQLGTGALTNSSTPVASGSTPGNSSKWINVACGYLFSFGLKADGSLWGWGVNDNGELGTNPLVNPSPLPMANVLPSGQSWVAVACGGYHVLALSSNGDVWAWGDNDLGQVGMSTGSTTLMYTTPQQISGMHNCTIISAGFKHSAAIKSDGTLWLWGDNSAGALGTGNTTAVNGPVQESTGSTSWTGVWCGVGSTLATQSDGSLWVWGSNASEQLGTGAPGLIYSSPVQVLPALNVIGISAGNTYSAVIECGSVTICTTGNNGFGQLGDGFGTGRNSWGCDVMAPN